MVDMVACTKSMRRRRQAFHDMTYRRRSVKAKQTLSSYTPVAPCQSNWGDIFDDMINELRGKKKLTRSFECQQCNRKLSDDNNSLYDNDGVSNVTCSSVGHLQTKQEVDELTRQSDQSNFSVVRSPWLVNSVSDYILDKNEISQEASPECNGTGDDVEVVGTETFWEENWSDNHVDKTNTGCGSGEKTPTTPCDACDTASRDLKVGTKPTLCYMNQKCTSFEANLAEEVNGTCSRVDNDQIESLQTVAFRRPDLASFKLPVSPIRKTDSSKCILI